MSREKKETGATKKFSRQVSRRRKIATIETVAPSEESILLAKEDALFNENAQIIWNTYEENISSKLLNDIIISALIKKWQEKLAQREEQLKETRRKIENHKDVRDYCINKLIAYQNANAIISSIDTELAGLDEQLTERLELYPKGKLSKKDLEERYSKNCETLLSFLTQSIKTFDELKLNSENLNKHHDTFKQIIDTIITNIIDTGLLQNDDALQQLKKELYHHIGLTETLLIEHRTEPQNLDFVGAKEIISKIELKTAETIYVSSEKKPVLDEITSFFAAKSDPECHENALLAMIVQVNSCSTVLEKNLAHRLEPISQLLSLQFEIKNLNEEIEKTDIEITSSIDGLKDKSSKTLMLYQGTNQQNDACGQLRLNLITVNELAEKIEKSKNNHRKSIEELNKNISGKLKYFKHHKTLLEQYKENLEKFNTQLTGSSKGLVTKINELDDEYKNLKLGVKREYDTKLNDCLFAIQSLNPNINFRLPELKIITTHCRTRKDKTHISLVTQLDLIIEKTPKLTQLLENNLASLYSLNDTNQKIHESCDQIINIIKGFYTAEFTKLIAQAKQQGELPRDLLRENIDTKYKLSFNETNSSTLSTIIQDYNDDTSSIGDRNFVASKVLRLFSPLTHSYCEDKINSLQMNFNKLNQHQLKLDGHLSKLNSEKGSELTLWQSRKDLLLSEFKKQHETTNDDFITLFIAESKVRCQSFQLSLHIMDDIDKEICRISRKYLPTRIANTPDDAAKLQRLYDILDTDDDNFTPQIIANFNNELLKQDLAECLPTIDPRLTRLFAIKQQFTTINKNFVEPTSYDELNHRTEETYRQSLMQVVNNTLHNDHMEDISEGKRSNFRQWIRIKLFKPLQNGATCLSHFFNSPQGYIGIKATADATDAEKNAIEIGNRYHEILTAAAPAA